MDQFTLDAEEVRLIDAYWRAANYLSVGQIYLYDNPLLRVPLTLAHVKPLVVGHWGTTPGQNFIYVHLNRVIKKHATSTCSTSPAPGMAARPSSATCTWRAPGARSTPTSPRTRPG